MKHIGINHGSISTKGETMGGFGKYNFEEKKIAKDIYYLRQRQSNIRCQTTKKKSFNLLKYGEEILAQQRIGEFENQIKILIEKLNGKYYPGGGNKRL